MNSSFAKETAMRSPLFLISLSLSSAACSASAEYADKAVVSDRPPASSSASASPPPAAFLV